MKHTSFPLAKQVYDKGVRIEDSEYRYYGDVLFQIDEVECILGKNDMSDDKLQTLLNFGDPIPSPTLCEWLEWLPDCLEKKYWLTIQKCGIDYLIGYYPVEKDNKLILRLETNTNPCDACAQLALWLLDNKLIGE